MSNLAASSELDIPAYVGMLSSFFHAAPGCGAGSKRLAADWDGGRQGALSPSRFAHFFREQVGAPPLRFLDLRRLDRAKRLLERSTLPIGAVAEEIGFDPLYFSRWFKRHMGMSPRAYRGRTEQTR